MSTKEEIKKEAERIKEDAEYTFKSQYTDADLWRFLNSVLSVVAATSATVAGFTQLKLFDWGDSAIIAGSFIASLSSVLLFSLKPLDKANEHHKAGVRFQTLRGEARIFYNVKLSQDGVGETELIRELSSLSKRLSELRNDSSQPSQLAYWLTKIGMFLGQNKYEVDREK